MVRLLCIITLLAFASIANAQEDSAATKPTPEPVDESEALSAGHSLHGEAFNEGPRQQAYLLPGGTGATGTVKFNVTSDVPEVKEFVEQGIGQVHGFWYFEAERSFRQAATLDPNCAIAYWGMAMANTNNSKRAKEFSTAAVTRKDKAGPQEVMYIDALDSYLNGTKKSTDKVKDYVAALEKIVADYPDDVEAKAQLGYALYKHKSAVKRSNDDVEKVLNEVLAAAPMHPVHHFRIHLWDYGNSSKALNSAAQGGQSSPFIAHMWHMPGHTYSRLKRYDDAAWQQEAAARVDHAHMMRAQVLPDQIHNFAHNNEWLIRDLTYIGRWRDAADLAKNMTELPQHPRYNTYARRGSAYYGRLRLFDVLSTYEMWDDMIALCQLSYLEPTDSESEQVKRLRHLGVAYVLAGKFDSGREVLADLEARLAAAKKSNPRPAQPTQKPADPPKLPDESKPADTKPADTKPADTKPADTKPADTKPNEPITASKADESAAPPKTAEPDSKTESKDPESKPDESESGEKSESDEKSEENPKPPQPTQGRPSVGGRPGPTRVSSTRNIEQAIDAIRGHLAASEGDFKAALPLLKTAVENSLVVARIQCLAGETDAAIAAVNTYVKSQEKRVQPLAAKVEILWLAGRKDEAKAAFEELRGMSSSIQFGAPVFDRLAPIAAELSLPEDWRVTKPAADDTGVRPDLDSLGPFRWQPSPAKDWTLKDFNGNQFSLSQYKDKPVVVIFYLGNGCLHCTEQLQAVAPLAEKFRNSGIELIAISTDSQAELKKSIDQYEGGMPFPLVSNAELDVFKSYRAFDDFEGTALHGTFLIDGAGLVRWHDISYEPFKDAAFLLKEAQRILARQDNPATQLAATAKHADAARSVVGQASSAVAPVVNVDPTASSIADSTVASPDPSSAPIAPRKRARKLPLP